MPWSCSTTADGILSHVQSGFNYFNPYGHDGSKETRHTISIVGSTRATWVWWATIGSRSASTWPPRNRPNYERSVTDAEGYVWQQGASMVAECLATGKEPLFTPEHALHVVEIICAARESQATGRRIDLDLHVQMAGGRLNA